MKKITDETVEDDLRYGQVVIVWARWSIVIFAFIMSLYRPRSKTELIVVIMGLLVVALLNFALHTRILMKQPTNVKIIYLASLADICLISVITGLNGGISSHVYLYFFPAVLVFALVFPSILTIWLTVAVLILYAGICLIFSDPKLQSGDETILIFRLLSILGASIVGNRYRSVEAKRRGKTAEPKNAQKEQVLRSDGVSLDEEKGVTS